MNQYQYNFNPLIMPLARLTTNRNWLAILTGEPGTGKSWTAMRIGQDLSKMTGREFTVKHIVFEVEDLLKLIQVLPPRSVIILDEAGVELAAREFMSARNRAMGKIFQVFRYKQLALIWTLPDMSMIDVQIRKLIQTFMETLPIDYVEEKTRVKWFNVNIDRWTGEVTRQYPRVRIKGVTYVARMLKFGKPSPELVAPYELNKDVFFRKLMLESQNEIQKSKGMPQLKKQRNVVSPATPNG